MPRIAVAKVIPFLELANFFGEKKLTFFKLQQIHTFMDVKWGFMGAICHEIKKYFCLERLFIEKKLYFCKKLVTMPSMELKDKLQRTLRKVETLRKRYLALLTENKDMKRTIESQELEIAKLEKELAQLRIDNEFLRVAHTVPDNPDAVAGFKKQVAKMVRDIDRCIKQLNA